MNSAQAELTIALPPSAAAEHSCRVEVVHWLTPRRFAIGLFALITLMFWDIVMGSRTFVFRDYALFGYPLALHHREAFWNGEIPLWNPLNNSGLPYLAQWNTMFFYPFSLIYILLPLPLSLGWFCLFHLFLAGLGMFHLAQRWTSDPFASAFAAIAFSFNGLALACLIWPNNIAALGWLPWVWLLAERGWNKGGKDLIKAILVGTCQMFSGAPEVIAFTWLIIALVWFVQLGRAAGLRWLLIRRTAIIVLLIAAAAAIQLLPFLDLFMHSHRQTQDSSSAWSIPLTGWANFLLPIFGCTKTAMGVYMQPQQGWTTSYYLGASTLLLAIVAVWKLRNPLVKALGLLAAASVLLASGDHAYAYSWLHDIFPAIGAMRYPVKLLVLTAAVVPLLAAMALTAWREPGTRRASEVSPSLVFIFLSGLFLIGVLIWVNGFFPNSSESLQAVRANGFTRAGVLIVALLLLFGLARSVEAHSSRREQIFSLALLGLTWIDLATHVPNQNPTVLPEAYNVKLTAIDELRPRPALGQSRAMLNWNALKTFSTTIVSNTFESLIGMRLSMYDNGNLFANIAKVDGFWSLYLPHEQEVRSYFYPGTNSIQPVLADFLGVSQITSEEHILEWSHRPSYMPMITAGQRPEFVTPDQTIPRMLSADFNPRTTVVLPLEARALVHGVASGKVNIEESKVTRHQLTALTHSEGPALVVVAQAHYHPWKAYVDGKPAPIFRANHAFQAVEVPAGAHKLELRYEDKAFKWGTWISAAAVLVCGLLYWRSRKGQPPVQLTPLPAV